MGVSGPSHRRDIDGLRGLSVALVAVYHFSPSLLPGGFVGVDVFFVISGFLITGLLLGTGDSPPPSLSEFYVRRITRIFPTLLLTLLLAIGLAWFAFLPSELAVFGQDLAASAAFLANLRYAGVTHYFTANPGMRPLLHLWSLGAEEQFYLLWPWILLVGQRLKSVAQLVGVLLLGSLVLCFVDETPLGLNAFYATSARAWEFLAGAFLHLGAVRIWSRRGPPEVVAAAGALMVLAAAIFTSAGQTFDGLKVLAPVLGALMLISAAPRSRLVGRLLSAPPLVWLGERSYAFYLYHGVLLAFAGLVSPRLQAWHLRALALLVSLLLADLTFRWVDGPLGKFRSARKTAVVLLGGMALLALIGVFLERTAGLPGIRARFLAYEAEARDLDFDIPNDSGWRCSSLQHHRARCFYTDPRPQAVMLGDSHVPPIYSGLRGLYQEKRGGLAVFGGGWGCPPLLDVVSFQRGKPDRMKCLERMTAPMRQILDDRSVREVLLTSRGPLYTVGHGFGDPALDGFKEWVLHFADEPAGKRSNAEVFTLGLGRTIDAFLAAGKKVTFLHDVPELGLDVRRCLRLRPWPFDQRPIEPCAIPRSLYEARTQSHRRLVEDVLRSRPQVRAIDLAGPLCDAQLCYARRNGVLYYADDDHLGHRGAAFVVDKLRAEFLSD